MVSETLGTVVILTSATETCSEQGERTVVWKPLIAAPFSANGIASGKCDRHDLVCWQPLRSWMAAGSSNYLLKAADSTAGSVP